MADDVTMDDSFDSSTETQPLDEQLDNVLEEPSQEVEGNEVNETVNLWESDPRWKTHWSGDLNKAYESFKNLDKDYTQTKQKYSEFENRIKEYEEREAQYQPVNQLMEFLEKNPKYSTEVENFFADLGNKIKRDNYPDLPDEVIEEIQAGKQALSRLNEYEHNQKVSEIGKQIDSHINEISEIAKARNISFDNSDQESFLKYCLDNNIPPSLMKAAFYEIALPEIEKSISMSSEKRVVGNLNKNRESTYRSGAKAPVTRSSVTAPMKTKADYESALDRALGIK